LIFLNNWLAVPKAAFTYAFTNPAVFTIESSARYSNWSRTPRAWFNVAVVVLTTLL
jgi:hypothetical protein